LAWCEDQEITLNNKAQAKLFDVKHWNALKTALDNALSIMQQVGTDEFSDFNVFKKKSMKQLKR
jgi:type I restriction enzyme M protein